MYANAYEMRATSITRLWNFNPRMNKESADARHELPKGGTRIATEHECGAVQDRFVSGKLAP